MSKAMPEAGQLGRSLPKDNVLLRCTGYLHEHYCGDIQVQRILLDVCPWDGSPLYRSAWWEGEVLVAGILDRSP